MTAIPGAPLTHRERGIVALVADGQSNKAIGAALHLSPLTVKINLARIAPKLGTGDRAGIVAAAHLTGQLAPGTVAGAPPVLSSRQVQIADLIAEGLSNPEIGGRLHLAECTVKTHLQRLLSALGARNRAHAVHLALSWHLIALAPRTPTSTQGER